jgi:tetratricopeptide (TPR) repeat protein
VSLDTGIANCRLKNYQQSKAAFNAGIKQWRELNDVAGLVNTLDELGMLYLECGQPRQAQKVFRQALNELIAIEDDPIYEYLLNAIKRHRQQANISPK